MEVSGSILRKDFGSVKFVTFQNFRNVQDNCFDIGDVFGLLFLDYCNETFYTR